MRKYEEAAKALVEELEAWYTVSQDPQRELLKRIAELERERDEFRDSLRFCHEQASLLAQDVARADRLAEAAEPAIRQLFSYDHAPGLRVAIPLQDALDAYRNVGGDDG